MPLVKMENIMTDTNDKQPTHAIFQVIGEADQARWVRIGAAWPNRDGKGFSIRLDALPVAGRTAMREVTDREGSGER